MHNEIVERLENVLTALERIALRNEHIDSEDDYYETPGGMEKLESTSMLLIAIGESLKGIDRVTNGELLPKYPQVDWREAKGLRDIIAHNYFQLDGSIILDTVKNDLPIMAETVKRILSDLTSTEAKTSVQ